MGKRIKDTDIIEQTKFEPKLRLLVDKMDADVGFPWMQAKNIQLKYLGNAYFQGSTNNSTWHDAIAAGDSFIRFSTDGGTTVKPLNTDTVREGPTNLYFTEARVIQTTGVADAVTAAHVHTNFTLLNNLISNGDGNSYLSNDGTYKNIDLSLYLPITPVFNNQTGTTYTIQSTDIGKLITFDNNSAITVTVPAGLPVGFNCSLLQLGAGAVSVVEDSVTINVVDGVVKTLIQYGSALLLSYTTNTFVLKGDLDLV